MKNYICKNTHTRALWVDNARYDFTFVKGNIYQMTKFTTYVILYLDDRDLVIKYVGERFKERFRIYETD